MPQRALTLTAHAFHCLRATDLLGDLPAQSAKKNDAREHAR
jgi:hypothetical protein